MGRKEKNAVERLLEFADWAKRGKMVKSRNEFEEVCGLSKHYLYNTCYITKGIIGVDKLAKIHDAFPMLNLTWVVTGKGAMIELQPDEGYKKAYLDMKKRVEQLKKDIEVILK